MPVLGLKRRADGSLRRQFKKGRNNDVSALFDSRVNDAVQITAQAVAGRFDRGGPELDRPLKLGLN